MKPHAFKLTFLILGILMPQLLHAAPATTVSLRLKRYVIRAEDDGIGGRGADLFMGYLVSGTTRSFGGSTAEVGGITTSNGQPKGTHTRNESLFTVDIPDGASVAIRLHLIESDETSERTKRAFAEARPPKFSDGARRVSPADVVNLFKSPATTIAGIFTGGRNTDDDYGSWTILLKNTKGKISVTPQTHDKDCTERVHNPAVPVDGKWRYMATLTYNDGDNDIDAQILVKAK